MFLWSVWWWLGQGVVELVLNYNTTLFYERDPGLDEDGLVVALGRGAAALSSLLPALVLAASPRGIRAMVMLAWFDLVGAALLFLSALLTSVYAAYALFVAFYANMQFVTATGNAAIATKSQHKQQQRKREREELTAYALRSVQSLISFFLLLFCCSLFPSAVFLLFFFPACRHRVTVRWCSRRTRFCRCCSRP